LKNKVKKATKKYFIPRGTRVWLLSGRHLFHRSARRLFVSERDMYFDTIDFDMGFEEGYCLFRLPSNGRNYTHIAISNEFVKEITVEK